MYRSMPRRVVPLVLVLLALALPAVAQQGRKPGIDPGTIVSVLWQRFEASLVSIWEKGRAHIDPDGAPAPSDPTGDATDNPPDETDGRAHIDPDG